MESKKCLKPPTSICIIPYIETAMEHPLRKFPGLCRPPLSTAPPASELGRLQQYLPRTIGSGPKVESAITSWANLRNHAVYGCLLAWSIFDNPQDFPLAKQPKK